MGMRVLYTTQKINVNNRYKKAILIFVMSLALAIFFLHEGNEHFSDRTSQIAFSIFATVSYTLGFGLAIWIYSDWMLQNKMLNEPTKEDLKSQEEWAGKLDVDKMYLRFFYNNSENLKIKLSDIKAIGEFTTAAELITIDWYLIIVKMNNELIYLPAYSVGFNEAIINLSEELGVEIEPKLFSSTNYDSNVLYPESLRNKKLFDFEGINPTNFIDRIKLKFGFKAIVPSLRKEIVEF